MKRKDLSMIKGVLLHPVKSLLFKIRKERTHYNIIISNRSRYRQKDKQRERALYMSSITKTNVIL